MSSQSSAWFRTARNLQAGEEASARLVSLRSFWKS